MSKEDGGPAFPSPKERVRIGIDEYVDSPTGGMSLRDYFAAKAPVPPKWWMDSYAKSVNDLDAYAGVITQWNYVYADSMLAARSAT